MLSLAGGALGLLVVGLLVVVSRAAARTASNAQEILLALQEVQARTAVLADLDALGEVTGRANGAVAAVDERTGGGGDAEPDRR